MLKDIVSEAMKPKCSYCNGSGKNEDNNECYWCDGTGKNRFGKFEKS